jgi:copper(I)-binding protein
MPHLEKIPNALAIAAVVMLSAVTLGAQAPLTITGAWVRESVPGRPNTAAYAVVENPGAKEVVLVSASCDAAAKVELHEMIRTGDMMKMQQVKEIKVPAAGKVELKPGGYHVMMFDLKKPLKDGEEISLTFTTSTGATIKVPATVKKGTM